MTISFHSHFVPQHSYRKMKTFSIASWAFILFAIPWDITYLVFANDLQTHAHTHCYSTKGSVDLQKILGTSLTCDEIRLAPPVVGVITILLLLLKVNDYWVLRMQPGNTY